MFSNASERNSEKQNGSTVLLSTHTSGKQHLSQPRGQHSVGFMDIMTPGGTELGTFMRLYYPTDEQCIEEHERWPVWAYEDKYVSGIFAFMKSMVYRWPSWAPRSEFLFYNKVQHLIKLVPHFGFNRVFKYMFGSVYIPIIENATVKKHENQKWPIVVFSHGIGCSRTMYSQICYDMASYGLIVAATEHREGSACMSRYYSIEDGKKVTNWVNHYQCEREENEYALRNRQVHLRSKEASRTLDVLLALQDGKNVENVFVKENASSIPSPSSLPIPEFSQFNGVMDTTKPIIAGHSFGGATTLLTLAEDTRFKSGIALDAWLFPVKDMNLSDTVKQPILFINTESFLNTRNLTQMATFENSTASDISEERRCYCIPGTVHQNHLDLPFLVQHTALKRILGLHSKTCPDVVMSLNNKLMVQFIFKHMGLAPDGEIDDYILRSSSLLQEGFGCFENIPTTDW